MPGSDPTPPAWDRRASGDARNAALCALAAVAATLLTLPFAEIGVADDFSYNYTARVFAETGRFVYNGWAAAMLGAQVLWGALFIKLFGFSFTMIRLAMLPFAAGSAVLIYLLARKTGLTAANAVLLTLTVALTPGFLGLAPSFMTDIFGLFFLLFSLYAIIKAGEPGQSFQGSSFWLLVCGVAALLGGSARQTVWIVPLCAFPLFAWERRSERRLAALALALWLTVIFCAKASIDWFSAQPYAILEGGSGLGGIRTRVLFLLTHIPVWILTITLLTLPVFIAAAPRLSGGQEVPRHGLHLFATALTLTGLGLFFALNSPFEIFAVIQDVANPPGYFVTGQPPRVFPAPLGLALLALALYLTLLPAGILLVRAGRWWQSTLTRRPEKTPLARLLAGASGFLHQSLREDRAFTLLAAVSLGYLALLAYRVLSTGTPVFDRYFLPTLPFIGVVVLRQTQPFGGLRPHLFAWVALALLGSYFLVHHL